MDKFELLCLLEAISNYAYDIHYTANGRFFFSDHLFSERLSDVDVKDDFIETFYLGKSEEAPASADIARKVADLTPEITDNTQDNFKRLRNMIIRALMGIQAYDGTKGEEDLLGSVAHILQRHNGLLYRQLTYTPEEIRNDDDDWRDIVDEEDTTQTLENEKWITVHPNKENPDDYRRLKVEDGETSKEAVERKFGKDKAEKKDPEKEDKEEKKDKPEERKSKQKIHPNIAKSFEYQKEINDAMKKMDQYRGKVEEKEKQLKEENKELQEIQRKLKNKDYENFTEFAYLHKQEAGIDREIRIQARESVPEYKEAWEKFNHSGLFEKKRNSINEGIKYIQAGLKDRLAEVSKENEELYNKIIGFGDELSILKKQQDEARKKRDDYYTQLWKKDMPADQIRAGIDEYQDKAVEAGKKIKELQNKMAHDIGDLLREKDGVQIKFEKSSIKNIENDLNEVFGGVLPDGMQPDVLPTVSTTRGRAHCSGRNLALNTDGGVQTAIHEYMHFVEDNNPQMLANSIAFLRYRTQGEKLKSLKSLTGISYGAKEKARPDKFFDPYCGKTYTSAFDDEKNEPYLGSTATEIMSMGVEQLYKDPVGFAKSDREYFDFVIANLKGRL